MIEGGEYTFSHCNGSSGTWVPEYTIINPSGEVEVFGAGDDGCSITWTATETGIYLVVINEADNCGVEGQDNNGFPALTTVSGGEECVIIPPMDATAVSFEGGALPECWESIDEDGDGFNWTFLGGSDEPFGFEDNVALVSYSFDNASTTALTPDNYLIMPNVTVGESDSLTYYVAGLDPNFSDENYSILLSTTGDEVADFTEVLFTETLSSADWLYRSIDLSAYEGQDVYLAIRHHDVSDEFAIRFDGILLPADQNCEIISTEDLAESALFEVFPNPTTENFVIQSNEALGMTGVRVVDITGKVVYSNQLVVNAGQRLDVQLGEFQSGIYIVELTTASEVYTTRIVKN